MISVVLTALEVEHAAVVEHLSGPLTERTERGLIFDVGTFGRDNAWTVAVAQVGPGNPGAGILLERAVTALRPDVAMFVGIAGGRKDVTHGDVVAADAVYDYETGRAGDDEYHPRIKTAAPSFALVQRAQAVVRGNRWQDRIRAHSPARRPRAFVKPIAAGSKVIAGGRSTTAAFLTRHCGDALAVDMESYGFLHGAYVNTGLATLVVRGISDLLDDRSAPDDEARRLTAARHAAAFAFAVLDDFTPEAAPPPHEATYHQSNTADSGGTVYANQGPGPMIIYNTPQGWTR
ncbi:phosphorylase [Dactylosporangium sp. CA-139066]|uniref:5'-methylthioadenosine/S-adenosylhomocysteine nucleosidase family protein n=1 Tax=Dactylosporangium sp. CA-139066 TaxID=3239930 RepID=UPI003D8E0E51